MNNYIIKLIIHIILVISSAIKYIIKRTYKIFKESSEIFLEAALIPLFITLSYFLIFIHMEERIILKQIKIGIDRISKEIYLMLQPFPEISSNKTNLIEGIENLDSKTLDDDNQASKHIIKNNQIYYKKALISVGIYASTMIFLSLISWFLKNNKKLNIKQYLICIAYPSLIAAGLIIATESVFIAFIMGNFMPIDANIFIKELLHRIYQIVELEHKKDGSKTLFDKIINFNNNII